MKKIDWLAEVEKRKEELIAKLMEFLRIPSVLDESTASDHAPFGRGVAEALDYMLRLGEQDGFRTKNVDGYAGHIEYGEGKELVGVLGHVDVVPASEGWTSPPFEPEIRDGKLYARGAQDDKGPVMAAYFALKIVKELGLPLSKRVRLILGCDEESHWRCVAHYFTKEEMPIMAFTPDADFPIIHGEKGFLDIRATGTPEKSGDGQWILQSFVSGQRVNMVPDLAEAILVGDGDVFELKEKFQDFLLTYQLQGYAEENDEFVKLVLRGRAHHGSEPDKGINAACELARFLQRVALDSSGRRFVDMIDQSFVDSFFGEKLGIEAEDQKVGKLTVNAGVFRYTRGSEQYAGINIRYPIDVDHQEILRKMEKKLAEFGLQLEVVDHKPGHYLDADHPLVSTLTRVYEEQTGDKARLLTIGGATYARAVETGVAYGPVFPGKAETAHQTDEYIEIEDLLKAAAIYAQAIYELAK